MTSSLFFGLLLTLVALLYSRQIFSNQTTISLYAVNTKTGEVLIDQNSALPLIPASTLKIVTTAAALELLKPETRLETVLEYDGTIDPSGTLHGNLYIRGGGDPCLGSNKIPGPKNWDLQIKAWGDAVYGAGIKKVQGRVVGDATCWESTLAPPSWPAEDLGNYFGAGACALSFHENAYTLVFKPGKNEGDPTTIVRLEPPLPRLTLHNEVLTGPAGSGDRAVIYGKEYSWVQHIKGTIPAGVEEFSIRGAIPDPTTFCQDLLSSELNARGIPVERKLNVTTHGGEKHPIQTTTSPTIGEIVCRTNQKSINLYAEHLLKLLGKHVHKEGSTRSGTQAITEFWEKIFDDTNGLKIADGSGLSRQSRISAKGLVSILVHMKKSRHYKTFLDSLPEQRAGIYAKSGTMTGIKAYAGYSDDIAFALIINNCTDYNETVNTVFDKIQIH